MKEAARKQFQDLQQQLEDAKQGVPEWATGFHTHSDQVLSEIRNRMPSAYSIWFTDEAGLAVVRTKVKDLCAVAPIYSNIDDLKTEGVRQLSELKDLAHLQPEPMRGALRPWIATCESALMLRCNVSWTRTELQSAKKHLQSATQDLQSMLHNLPKLREARELIQLLMNEENTTITPMAAMDLAHALPELERELLMERRVDWVHRLGTLMEKPQKHLAEIRQRPSRGNEMDDVRSELDLVRRWLDVMHDEARSIQIRNLEDQLHACDGPRGRVVIPPELRHRISTQLKEAIEAGALWRKREFELIKHDVELLTAAFPGQNTLAHQLNSLLHFSVTEAEGHRNWKKQYDVLRKKLNDEVAGICAEGRIKQYFVQARSNWEQMADRLRKQPLSVDVRDFLASAQERLKKFEDLWAPVEIFEGLRQVECFWAKVKIQQQRVAAELDDLYKRYDAVVAQTKVLDQLAQMLDQTPPPPSNTFNLNTLHNISEGTEVVAQMEAVLVQRMQQLVAPARRDLETNQQKRNKILSLLGDKPMPYPTPPGLDATAWMDHLITIRRQLHESHTRRDQIREQLLAESNAHITWFESLNRSELTVHDNNYGQRIVQELNSQLVENRDNALPAWKQWLERAKEHRSQLERQERDIEERFDSLKGRFHQMGLQGLRAYCPILEHRVSALIAAIRSPPRWAPLLPQVDEIQARIEQLDREARRRAANELEENGMKLRNQRRNAGPMAQEISQLLKILQSQPEDKLPPVKVRIDVQNLIRRMEIV